MSEECIQKISDYLKSHNKMTLATIAPDGRPQTHTVEYAPEGAEVYFCTMRTTRKAWNIANNPNVAYSVDEDYEDWMKIQGVQMEGRAEILSDPKETRHAIDVYLKKFPQGASFLPNPNMVFVKIKPVTGFFLDYVKKFGHRNMVKF